jgi:hypothetical protein
MKRGICTNGHMDHCGNLGDICGYTCICGRKCSKKLKSWANGYETRICECMIVEQINNKPDKGICPAGHITKKYLVIDDYCDFICDRCNRVCSHVLQPANYVTMNIMCECFDDMSNKKLDKKKESLRTTTYYDELDRYDGNVFDTYYAEYDSDMNAYVHHANENPLGDVGFYEELLNDLPGTDDETNRKHIGLLC